jgi:hypothetical protein
MVQTFGLVESNFEKQTHKFDPCDKQRIIFRIKYVFAPCNLKTLFFISCSSSCIADGTSFMAKHRDDTFVKFPVKKLTEAHVNISKKLTCIIYLIKNLKNLKN